MLDKILEEIKSEKPCIFQNTSYTEVFSWGELENLLNLRPFVNADRMKTAGDIPFSWENQAWLSDINSFPPSLLDKAVRENLCLLIDASRVNKQINSICESLEKTFVGAAADAHIVFTLSESVKDTFGIHWDSSHNLILQVAGETEMKVWNEWSLKDRIVESLDKQPVIDTNLKPGDFVFVPKYHYYSAISSNKRLSISFPISYNNECPTQDRHWISL